MTFILLLLSILATLWLWLLLSPAHRATYRDRLDSNTHPPVADLTFPPVVVVLAARNEADMLPTTLPTICRQDYPNLDVLVVDDQSDDDSPNVLARLCSDHPNLAFIRSADRPAGWMGKCWAMQQGIDHLAAQSAGQAPEVQPILLFTDADILFHPSAVRQAVAHLQSQQLDMLSLMPRCICETPIERLGVGGLMTLLSLMFPTGWANDPRKKWSALACGAFMLVRPEAYHRVGGHACVRASMIEDINLARRLKQADGKVCVLNTRDLVSTRMYEGFRDLWEGLTKNAYAGMEYQPRKFWVGLIAGLMVSVFPPIYLLLTALWAARSPHPASIVACGFALLANLCIVLIHSRTVRHLRLPILYSLGFPLSSALYNLIAIDSAIQHHFRGGNVWKGRRYDRSMLLDSTLPQNPSNETGR